MKGYFDTCNEAPSYYMWRVLDQRREPLRKQLAALAGCSPEEIAIHRNTSEALETVVQGISLKALAMRSSFANRTIPTPSMPGNKER